MTTRKTREPARAQGKRQAGGRARGYPSDLTDAQWQVMAAHLPADRPGRRDRPRIWPLRRIVEAILYVDRTGCAWRYLPADFPTSNWARPIRPKISFDRGWLPILAGVSAGSGGRPVTF